MLEPGDGGAFIAFIVAMVIARNLSRSRA